MRGGRIGIRLASGDVADGNAVQQRRAGIGFGLRAFAAVDRGRTGDIGARRETALHPDAAHRRAVLPAVAVAVVEHGADDQRFIQHRIAHQLHVGSGDVGNRGTVVQHLRGVGMGAGAYARADPEQVGDGGAPADRDVDLVDRDRIRPHQAPGTVVVGHRQRAVDIGESGRRRIDQGCIHHRHFAGVLHRQGVAHQVADLDVARLRGLDQVHGGRIRLDLDRSLRFGSDGLGVSTRPLSAGGDPGAQQCGWLKDRYGLSWQIVPTDWLAMAESADRAAAERAMRAMFTMKKLDIAALQRAVDGR